MILTKKLLISRLRIIWYRWNTIDLPIIWVWFFRGQAEREFRVEVEAIGHVRHKNLVRLLGYCIEGSHRWFFVLIVLTSFFYLPRPTFMELQLIYFAQIVKASYNFMCILLFPLHRWSGICSLVERPEWQSQPVR